MNTGIMAKYRMFDRRNDDIVPGKLGDRISLV